MSYKVILQACVRQSHRLAPIQSTRLLQQNNRTIKKEAALKATLSDCISMRSSSTLCKNDFEKISDKTLDTLSEFFEDLEQNENVPQEFDVVLESGVLTIAVSKTVGTYVINKQAPNKQIWLSSPVSGPKRYDFCDNSWIYLLDKTFLHTLLESEFSRILNSDINMSKLPYYKSGHRL